MEYDETVYRKIDAYIRGELSEDDKNAFEEEMAADIRLKKEVMMQLSVKDVATDNGWNLIEKKEYKEEIDAVVSYRRSEVYERDIQAVKQGGKRYFEKEENQGRQKKKKYLYALLGAVGVIIFFFVTLFTGEPQTSELYAMYNEWDNLPSFVTQGTQKNILIIGEQAFTEKEYERVIAIFTDVVETNKTDQLPYVLAYLGASYLELEAYEKAITVFDQLLETETVESSKAYWYKAMVYLRKGDVENVKKQLHLILNDPENYNFDKATQLLEEL
ncbi:hypothetical protein HN014_05425 [Aquimarina sp. TRL1]|uniref:tetratricopeptide repeat protein n=1 Tax=Aquimarina sp. (strain TRL1) TaxID=2736252 RepID=UPI00158ED116|nr:hypothetical protein [Aquimarina sp. TRL1]QKX04371.1 hypothetical protein HN014_05425 [Aquimarina sp. TRL1]